MSGPGTSKMAGHQVLAMKKAKDESENRTGALTGTCHDKLTIVDRVAHFIERFVFLKNRALYLLIALWVIATYISTMFEFIPYIFAYSPEKQSGKTRLLEVFDELVYSSSGILIFPSPAVLFRTAQGNTQLMDEVDVWSNRDELRGVLNAGFQRRGTVTRMDPDGMGGYRAVRFRVYAPRALAGIGLNILDATTRDRTFAILMVRQTKEEKREKFRLRKLQSEIDDLKNEIVFWVVAHDKKVAAFYDQAFEYLEQFGDRTIDIAEPLAAILEIAYKDSPRLEEVRQDFLEAISITRDEKQEDIQEHRIIRELTRLAEKEDPLIGNVEELLEMCSNLPDDVSTYHISRALRKYEFKSKSIRKDGVPKYRYVLHYKELNEILTRYAGSTRGSPKRVTFLELLQSKSLEE